MQINEQITIDASANQVWKVLGQEFDRVDEWISAVSRSSARAGAGPGTAPMTGRICETDLGPFTESLVEFDEEARTLAYEAEGDKMPFFVRGMRNRWVVTPVTDRRSRVDMQMEADLMVPFNVFMGPILKRQLATLLAQAVEELKHYVETGRPHPRKEEAGRGVAMAA